jgi:hypothetical protein
MYIYTVGANGVRPNLNLCPISNNNNFCDGCRAHAMRPYDFLSISFFSLFTIFSSGGFS